MKFEVERILCVSWSGFSRIDDVFDARWFTAQYHHAIGQKRRLQRISLANAMKGHLVFLCFAECFERFCPRSIDMISVSSKIIRDRI